MLYREKSLRVLFLVLALVASGGFRFRCYWLCTDQTSIQEDYVEQRDQCRQFAQLKYDAMAGSGAATTQSRDAELVKLFAECMGKHGWQVPAGEGGGPALAAAPLAPTTPMGTATTKRRYSYEETTTAPAPAAARGQNGVSEKAALSRRAECDFARESAAVSHIAADRAAACDAECEHALKANPNGPLPAACPSDYPRPAVTATALAAPHEEVKPAAKTRPVHVPKPAVKPKSKPSAAHITQKPTPVPAPAATAMPPMPAPPPLPPKPANQPSPKARPVPISVVTPPGPAASSLLSALLGADIALVLILLVLYAAQRYARRRKPQPPRRIPSLSAKIRRRPDDQG